jgi:hypothetical protein
MARNPETSFKLVSSAREAFAETLTVDQRLDVVELVDNSVRADFPGRSTQEYNKFGLEAQRMRHNPNLAVGGPLLRGKQRFAHPLSVLAIRNNSVVAHLSVAENVSSSRPAPLAQLEMEAKLRSDKLLAIRHRYMWLGYAAMSPGFRAELADTSSDEVNNLDVMIALASSRHDARQPVSAYPWEAEGLWKDELASIGLAYQDEKSSTQPFSSDGDVIYVEHWNAEAVEEVQGRIAVKYGAEEAIETAWRQLQ